jgi:hypothetical protein
MSEPPKGLATVAFLKTKLDEGCDHLGLLEPLVLDALVHFAGQDFLADDIKVVVHQRTGVALPSDVIQTLLGRQTRHGLLKRAGGRFFRTSKAVPDPGLDAARATIQAEQASLGEAFIKYAATEGLVVESPAEALGHLATFVSDNKVRIILNEQLPDSPLDRSSLDRKLTRVIARFIGWYCLQSAELRPALAALTEGILLEDTLLMRDLPGAGQTFQDLTVLLDTAVLFAAVDLTGVANAVAAKEAVALLRQSGARTLAFRPTVDEMRRILGVYEEHLGTSEGRLTLHPTALTQHVLTARLSPADVRIISTTLKAAYTLGEAALAKSLAHVGRPDPESPRVRHDVDCVAGVVTLRRGRISESVERSAAIFCTTSGGVVRTVQQWFVAERGQGIPPIIHQAALTTIAWLKKPAAAPDLKMHELAALCAAAMRPTHATMEKFTATLRRMRSENVITDDETAAIVASELMEPLLARLDDDFEPDSDSIQEAIERVRDTYRREAVADAEEAVTKAQAGLARDRQAAEEAVRMARAEAAQAQLLADQAIAARNNLVERVGQRISVWSSRACSALFWAGVAVLVFAAVLSVPGVFEAVGGPAKWIARVVLVVSAALGVYSCVHGAGLKDLRRGLQERIAKWLRSLLLPADVRPLGPEIASKL